MQRYDIISRNASNFPILTSVNVCVKKINDFFLGRVGDYTLWFHPNLSNGNSPLFDNAKIQNNLGEIK